MVAGTAVARGSAARSARNGVGRRAGARADRDGDVSMDGPAGGRGKVGKSTAKPARRGGRNGDPATTGILSATAQRHILRQAANGDVNMKSARPTARSGLVELKITGWEKSSSCTSKDRGVSSLITWLEKKASRKLGSSAGRREVRIRKSRVEGDTIFISVQPEDLQVLLRMDGFTWSAVTITIKRSDGVVDTAQPSSEAEKTKAMLRSVLERRYDMDAKFLDLSALGQDEELKASAIFDSKSTTSKFFPALMRVLELAFDKKAERDAAIQSVSLAHNDLENLTVVSTLSETLPNLHNLDLSNNKLATLDSISLFRRRFHHLNHLIVSGNPLEQNEPNYGTEIVKWYSSLTQLNNIQVRTAEEAAARSKVSHMPFPIRSPLFQDEGGIAENFIRNFFVGIDTDRTALANVFYDDNSEFSFAVNTSAPRDPADTNRPAPQEWEQYINNSRNLKRLTQLPARKKRQFSGAKVIADVLASLPATKHPDLAMEATKWLIESHIQPNVPDPTGQSPTGVDGFQISVHGEFQELQPTTGQPGKQRSVDHLFIVGPGGSTGVRIHSHHFTIRAYGGSQAYQPEDLAAYAAIVGTSNLPASQPASTSIGAPENPAATTGAVTQPSQPPAGMTVELAEQMVLELQKQTRMTLQYAKDCLEQVSWDFNKALEVFANVRATLPAEAFVAVA